jgi:peptidyl-dipeptidase A
MSLDRFAVSLALVTLVSCLGPQRQAADVDFEALKATYLERYEPLVIASNEAWWDAAISGSDEAYERRKIAETELSELHSDREVFARIRALKEAGAISDPTPARELLVMHSSFLSKQADPELNRQIIALEADVDQIFNTHRSQVRGKRLTENDVRKILKESKDSELAKAAWSGYMAVGRDVDAKLKELVKLRNQVAQMLGYENFFALMMEIQEFDQNELFRIFDELDQLTREPFAQLKRQIDDHMVQRFGLASRAELRPWHTGDLFFQEAPDLGDVSLDDLYVGKDPVELSRAHYESMGMEVAAIIERSSLYEKEGKSPHAFATSIDRDQDVRVLCNVKPNANWMDTMHHELGHGVYDQYIGKPVPFILHEPSHILTTEGMAMLFGSLTKNGEFIEKVVGADPSEAARYAQQARRTLRAEKLIFSRWSQVMLRFEKSLYEDPDRDLNRLWWDLKKKYQLLDPPDDLSGADYGAKIHVVAAPVYYHNYLLGELFASQVLVYAAKHYAGTDDPHTTSFYGNTEAGDYFRREVFEPGNLYTWRELTRRATGESLSAKPYAALYVE